MVTLLGENTLLVLQANQRGQTAAVLLENVEDAPKDVRPGLVRVTVASAQPNKAGQATLTLPSGQQFLAKLPQELPQGSTLLLQMRPQGQAPQVLRVLLPSQGQQPAQIQPSTGTPTLLNVAQQSGPTLGQTVALSQPKAPLPTQQQPPIPQPQGQQPTKVQPPLTGQLPTVGAKVLGQITSLPQGGFQTFTLANGTPLQLATPPVFATNTTLTLRILHNQQAVIEDIALPQSQNKPPQHTQTQPQQTPPQQQTNQPPLAPRPQATPVPQGVLQSAPQTPAPIAQFKLTQPAPPALKVDVPLQAQVMQVQQNNLVLRLDKGAQIRVQFVAAPPQGQNRQNLQTPQNITAQPIKPTLGQQISQQQNNPQTSQQHPFAPNTQITIRLTANGLIDVLQTAPKQQPPQAQPLRAPISQPQGRNQPSQTGSPVLPNVQANTSAPLAPKEARIATGTVVEQKPNGGLILQFDKTTKVEVQAQRILPIGSKISIQIMPDGHAEIIHMYLPKSSERNNTLMRFSIAWENLNKTIETLGQKNPQAQEKLIQQLPRANETLLPQLIQFSQAVAQQNLQAVFSDDLINILRALGLDGMLQTDMNQLGALTQPRSDSPDGWRSLLFPYWDEQEQQTRQGGFFWRRQQADDGENNSDESALRFVLNVQLSELGQTQLDGLLQTKDMLHLKLRTQNGLSEEEQKGLEDIVHQSLKVLGIKGQIMVKKSDFFDVDPLHEMLVEGPRTDHEIITTQLNVKA